MKVKTKNYRLKVGVHIYLSLKFEPDDYDGTHHFSVNQTDSICKLDLYSKCVSSASILQQAESGSNLRLDILLKPVG